MENKVDVVIGGEIVTLTSTESADYLQRLALYADQKIGEIKAKSKAAVLNDHARSLIIALNIADDYHKALDKLAALVPRMKKLMEENTLLTTEMKTMKVELAATQKELDAAKKELDEFVKSFDADNKPEGENILTLPQAKRKTAVR